MALLRNSNGVNYKILSSRPSKLYKGHRDYLVESDNKVKGISIVRGWDPKKREWEHGDFYGFDSKAALLKAHKDFKTRRDER